MQKLTPDISVPGHSSSSFGNSSRNITSQEKISDAQLQELKKVLNITDESKSDVTVKAEDAITDTYATLSYHPRHKEFSLTYRSPRPGKSHTDAEYLDKTTFIIDKDKNLTPFGDMHVDFASALNFIKEHKKKQ